MNLILIGIISLILVGLLVIWWIDQWPPEAK